VQTRCPQSLTGTRLDVSEPETRAKHAQFQAARAWIFSALASPLQNVEGSALVPDAARGPRRAAPRGARAYTNRPRLARAPSTPAAVAGGPRCAWGGAANLPQLPRPAALSRHALPPLNAASRLRFNAVCRLRRRGRRTSTMSRRQDGELYSRGPQARVLRAAPRPVPFRPEQEKGLATPHRQRERRRDTRSAALFGAAADHLDRLHRPPAALAGAFVAPVGWAPLRAAGRRGSVRRGCVNGRSARLHCNANSRCPPPPLSARQRSPLTRCTRSVAQVSTGSTLSAAAAVVWRPRGHASRRRREHAQVEAGRATTTTGRSTPSRGPFAPRGSR